MDIAIGLQVLSNNIYSDNRVSRAFNEEEYYISDNLNNFRTLFKDNGSGIAEKRL